MTAKQIAIDGPASAGKSTAAKLVAKKLGYLYVDTGAMYRAVALIAIRENIDFSDEQGLTALTQRLNISLEGSYDSYQVFVNDEDVSLAIRRPEVGNAASPVSAVEGVRKVLVAKQQAMAQSRPVVMDGRDIGTVVLPHADCKIFLIADPLERARRRAAELAEKGIEADIEGIHADIIERDHRDSNRANSPLKQAEDAYLLDNSHMQVEQVVEKILNLAEKNNVNI